VYYDDNQAYVFCAVDGVAQRRDVTVGLYSDETAAITSGLFALDQVIVSWSPRLRGGAAVRPINEVELPPAADDTNQGAEGAADAGASGTDNAGTGSAGTGDSGTGNAGTGNAGTGDTGTEGGGDAAAGGA
ncbi:MAG: hypothetical protein J6T26_03930, partial [Firmicutes bacterium]|nr:hypothetical protein [Bacillota bacterium]